MKNLFSLQWFLRYPGLLENFKKNKVANSYSHLFAVLRDLECCIMDKILQMDSLLTKFRLH